MAEEERPPVKRMLVYSIKTTITPAGSTSRLVDPPAPPPDADGGRRQTGRRRSCSPTADAAAQRTPRASVHDRLGPRPAAGGHVVPRGSGASSRGVPDGPAALTPRPASLLPGVLQEQDASSTGACVHAVVEAVEARGSQLDASSVIGGSSVDGDVFTPTVGVTADAESLSPAPRGPLSERSPAGPPIGREVAAQVENIAVAEDAVSTLQALEALMFVEAATTAAPPTMSAGELKVYFRRKRCPRHPPPTTVPQQPHATAAPPPPSPHTLHDIATSAPEVQNQAALSREELITGLTKRVEGLVAQPPPVQKRRPRAPPPTSAPRRSRRNAGLGAEFAGIPYSTGARKTVIRSLDIALEQEHVDQKVLNDYAKLFGHPLSESHVQALAALFGWTVPVEYRSVSAAIQC